MYARMLALVLTVGVPMANSQVERATRPTVEEHIREVIRALPSDSLLRGELLQGARGTGVHYAWMDEMRKADIKRVIVWVDIQFDGRGRPKQIRLDRTQYFTGYDGSPVSNSERLDAIRRSGLEDQLNKTALERAAHGSWLELPRPRPKPFVGGAKVEFLDDEWLPIPPLLYYVGAD